MSVEIDGRIFRNIQEQVQKNKDDIAALSVGFLIVGSGEEVPENLQPGQAWIKVDPETEEKSLLINTEQSGLIDLGQWPPRGPQGLPGQQGEAAEIAGVSCETITLAPGTAAFASATVSGNNIQFNFEIPQGARGIQGERGPQGPQGIQGAQGIQGERGEPSYAVKIVGLLAASSSLPSPRDVDRNSAYLVGASAPYDLYVIIGDAVNDRYWKNVGNFSPAMVTVDTALNGQSTNPVQNKAVYKSMIAKQDGHLVAFDFTNADVAYGTKSFVHHTPSGYDVLDEWIEILSNADRLSLDIRNTEIFPQLALGARFYLDSYDTYDFAIGSNGAPAFQSYDNYGFSWINNESGSAWLSEDCVLRYPTTLNYARMALFKRKDGESMTQDDIDWIKAHFHYAFPNHSAIGPRASSESFNPPKTARFAHFSLDDVEFCLTNLADHTSTFTSIFDDPLLAFLKDLHETYGAVFSLYVYLDAFLALDSTYAKDFKENADWLKFGLHLNRSRTNYSDVKYSEAKSDYEAFVTQALAIGLPTYGIDRIPRFHNYALCESAADAMKNCDCGIIGMLTPDDDRTGVNYLSASQIEYLIAHDKLYEEDRGLWFYSTDMRLDWFRDSFTSQYQYLTPVKNSPYFEFVYRYGSLSVLDKYDSFIVFVHEWVVYTSSYSFTTRELWMRFILDALKGYGYDFDYPMYRCGGKVQRSSSSSNKIKKFVLFEPAQEVKAVDAHGVTVSSTNRITTDRFYLPKGSTIKIKVASGWKAKLVSWSKPSSNSDFVTEQDFAISDFTLTNAGELYYAISIGRADNADITVNAGVQIWIAVP